MTTPLSTAGLEDVVITTSAITFIDGDKGILRYRGYDVNELAEKSTFEETAYLILNGRLPAQSELSAFQAELRQNRAAPPALLQLIKQLPPKTDSMAWLRTAVSALAAYDSEAEDGTDGANRRKTIRLTGQMATLVAAIERIRHGQDPILPDPALDHAANFLYMLSGKKPDDLSRRAIDIALILQADHELNASTFSARVTVATLSDMYSGVTSAVGTLKGPLHGGANQRVMEMLQKIGSLDKVEPFVREQLASKKKIMGFGHRVYIHVDPRAAILKRMSKELSAKVGPAKWYEMSERMEALMLSEKKLNPNLDFYSASVYQYLGIPIDLYPMIFAASRVIGWCTHILEQYGHNRLIRPLAEYKGPAFQPYQAIAERASAPVPR
jgi:citrate synthase